MAYRPCRRPLTPAPLPDGERGESCEMRGERKRLLLAAFLLRRRGGSSLVVLLRTFRTSGRGGTGRTRCSTSSRSSGGAFCRRRGCGFCGRLRLLGTRGVNRDDRRVAAFRDRHAVRELQVREELRLVEMHLADVDFDELRQ